MKHLDVVRVIAEKAAYAKDGVHKGMYGWICDERCISGHWLVNFPRFGEKDDIATLSVLEIDLEHADVLRADLNEEIEKRFMP